MNRNAFLLGFLATSGQVLLLREIVTAFGGTELLIGTALFGWLVWVALGALIGGRTGNRLNPRLLLVVGVMILPLSLVAIRFLPMMVTSTVGEMVPITTASALAILVVGPVGLLSGLLFPVIAKEGRESGEAIASVYLFEGIGAFAAGLVTTALITFPVGNLGTGIIVGAVVGLVTALEPWRYRLLSAAVTVGLLAMLAMTDLGTALDQLCDQLRYPGYAVEQSFDTPYGHQTMLSRDSSTVLLTDNAVEAVYPDLERAENLLISPLAYCPEAANALFFGRAEFGLEQLALKIPNLHLKSVDPRSQLYSSLELTQARVAVRIQDDPVAYLGRSSDDVFDIIIIGLGRLDSYRASRLITSEFMQNIKRHLKPDGVLLLATAFDTDRYLTAETGASLAIITRTVGDVFPKMTLWPGNSTLVFASEQNDLSLGVDSILSRLSLLPYRPEYVSEFYLPERLGELKRTRLQSLLAGSSPDNRIDRPVLATAEVWRRARASIYDQKLADVIYRHTLWLLGIPIALVAFFIWTAKGRAKGRTGLLLYFIAGVASLSLELISFYLFQSTVGSLYTHLAVLIGVFMLGLAVGTWFGSRTIGLGIGWLSLSILASATVMFALTWKLVPSGLALAYYTVFLLVIALATGTLFVAATRHYYSGFAGRSRGTGYAMELTGSACGALLATGVLLPILGVNMLLSALALLIIIALAVNSRPAGRRLTD